jgi:hypothetical protein
MAKAAGTSDRSIRDAKVAHRLGLTEVVKQGGMSAHDHSASPHSRVGLARMWTAQFDRAAESVC